jgi:outer membrane receptor protein involved in Fe transport
MNGWFVAVQGGLLFEKGTDETGRLLAAPMPASSGVPARSGTPSTNPKIMNTTRTFAFALFAATASWQGLLAQTTNPASQASPIEEEPVLELSPFEVRADEDTGYQATQSLAGTRIRTDLKDVASAISVVTKEFMQDIGATDSGTLLQYTTNAEVAGTRGTYAGLGNATSVDESANLRAPAGAQRVRGLAAADNTRDFFVTDIPWDSYIVDRIDIQRGPNSILFGLGSPAGIVNASLRNAEFRNKGSVEFRTGSYGSTRASFDLNQVLIKDVLAIRLDGLWNNEKFQQNFAFQDDKRVYGAIRFDPQLFKDPSFRTSFKAKFENGDIKANRPRTVTPNDSLSAWFRPVAISADNPFGGMGKLTVESNYDAGVNIAAINRYLATVVNQQQPIFFMDGVTGQQQRIYGGYVNTGNRSNTGAILAASAGIPGRRYSEVMYRVGALNDVALALQLPGYQSGQYRTQSLTDPGIFDYNNNLIDGPTKSEFEKWNAYNLSLSQTGWGDRVGVEINYDRQDYRRGGQALLGGAPTITIDVTRNLQDYYLTSGNASAVSNPNFARPFVSSNGGSGSSYESERKYLRGSLFGEVRARDFLENDFLVKLLGKHRFNGVFSEEKYATETRGWVMYANDQAWAGYWNGNSGSGSSITDRPPTSVIYLGSSVLGLPSANLANIPGITSDIQLKDGSIYLFDSTWQNFAVPFGDPWVPTGNLTGSGPFPVTNAAGGAITYTQNSNPNNYVGWTSARTLNLMRYNNGADESLLTRAQKSMRETKSYAASWQGFLWNDALVATLGWRYDEVKGKAVNAAVQGGNRSILNLNTQPLPGNYYLPSEYPANQIFKDHSTSGGAVLHLNKLFGDRDPLPINVSVSYNKSNNFQVTDTRRDIYGTAISNPTGSTKDIGILLSTKDGKYSFRAIKYETSVMNASSGISNPGGVGGIVATGLRFRNVFLYDLGVYDWGSRNAPQGRNTWGGSIAQGDAVNGADQTLTSAQGRALEDAAIRTWNQIQADLTAKGFFAAWGFTPQDVPLTLDRTTYEANPSAYVPADTSKVFAYGATPPPGFTVTADTMSEGYEFEFTANPTKNWRIAFNASQTEATRTNVGGQVLEEYIAYIDEKLGYGTGGTPAGNLPQFGNTSLSVLAANWAPWRGNYTLLKLQEGTAASELRKWRYNVITNYSFSEGRLKGVGVGGSYRWQDKVVIGYPIINNSTAFDLTKPYFGPSEDAVDLWASYGRKLNNRINWKIQLNVRNALAKKQELIPISIQPDGNTWASVRIAPVREWFVTNTFSF